MVQLNCMKLKLQKLSESQLELLVNISADLGVVSVASVVLPSVLDKFHLFPAIVGIVIALSCWYIGLLLLSLAKKE